MRKIEGATLDRGGEGIEGLGGPNELTSQKEISSCQAVRLLCPAMASVWISTLTRS
jgi:hypothetical protein